MSLSGVSQKAPKDQIKQKMKICSCSVFSFDSNEQGDQSIVFSVVIVIRRRHRRGRVDGFIQLLNNINNKYCLNTTNNLLIEQTMNTIQTFHAMNEQSEKYEGAFSRWNDFLSKNLIVLNIPLNLRNSKRYICAHNMLDCLFWMNGLAQVGPARNQEP